MRDEGLGLVGGAASGAATLQGICKCWRVWSGAVRFGSDTSDTSDLSQHEMLSDALKCFDLRVYLGPASLAV